MAGKVLVVDDDASVQRLLQYTLKQEGYDVIDRGRRRPRGCALWQLERAALILLDVTLQPSSTATRSRRGSAPRRARATTSRSSC